MPIAGHQDAQLLHYILQSKPTGIHNVAGSIPQNNCSNENGACASDVVHITSGTNVPSSNSESGQYFSTNSPPLLNLSPNLSPTNELQRTSPFYDLRETTRRRGYHESQRENQQQMHHPASFYPGIIAEEVNAVRKSESPSRKRRKTSNSIIDLTNSPSPPPTSLAWETAHVENIRPRRRNPSQRRPSGERSHTPRSRRSPGTRRRSVRDRHHQRNGEELPEQQSFQVPLTTQHIHPASLPLQQQQPVIVDVDQVQGAAAPVTRAPYAIPVCTRPHVPICTTGHIPVCATTQPTWSFPACSVQLPTCSIQHIPACSIPQVPLTSHPLPPMFSHSHPTPQTSLPQHHPHHRVPPTQFNITPAHQRRPEEDVTMLGDHRPPYHQIHHTGFHHHHPPTLNPSPPLILQEPAVHPSPQDIFGPFQRFYAHQRSMGRSTRLRNFPPPPPPYPGFLLHFLAMLGNPPVPPYGRDLHDDATEVENYEALLNLAERLGEAKPRGLVKAEIEQLPAYRFNGENQRSVSDQTSCVVCMCDFENRQLLRVLPCSHEFHAKCVDKWLKTNRTCPICRADASEIGNQSD